MSTSLIDRLFRAIPPIAMTSRATNQSLAAELMTSPAMLCTLCATDSSREDRNPRPMGGVCQMHRSCSRYQKYPGRIWTAAVQTSNIWHSPLSANHSVAPPLCMDAEDWLSPRFLSERRQTANVIPNWRDKLPTIETCYNACRLIPTYVSSDSPRDEKNGEKEI